MLPNTPIGIAAVGLRSHTAPRSCRAPRAAAAHPRLAPRSASPPGYGGWRKRSDALSRSTDSRPADPRDPRTHSSSSGPIRLPTTEAVRALFAGRTFETDLERQYRRTVRRRGVNALWPAASHAVRNASTMFCSGLVHSCQGPLHYSPQTGPLRTGSMLSARGLRYQTHGAVQLSVGPTGFRPRSAYLPARPFARRAGAECRRPGRARRR